jgi:drug/metabolite transporter (DMT)-like permease
VLNSTSPVFVTLITLAWTRHEAIGWRRIVGLLAGLAGVVVIIGAEALGGLGQSVAGQAAIVLATLGFAMAAIWGRKFSQVPVEVTAAGTLTFAGITLLPFALAIDEPWLLAPTRASVVALVMQAAFGGALGFVLYFRLVRTLGSLGVASVGYLKAAFSVAIGVAIMGEPLTLSLVAGLALVVAGVALINETAIPGGARRKQRAPAA